MTDEELKALVAENSLAIRESRQEAEQVWQELRASRQESQKLWQESRQETERLWHEVRDMRRESEKRWRESRQESEKRWRESRQESEKRRQESEKRWQESRQEILASRQETDRLISSFNKQLGNLGNAFGDYTESLFRPSLERALREQFGMTTILSPLRLKRDGHELEIDVVGYAGDEHKEVYLAEIKSQLRQDGIAQILADLRQFPRFFPEHRGKKLFGILAAVDIPPDLRAQVIKKGLYLATIKDDVFEIAPPDGFTPRAFGLREA